MRAIRQTAAQIWRVFGLFAIGGRLGAGFEADDDADGTLEMEDRVQVGFVRAGIVKMKRMGKTARERDFVKINRARAGDGLVAGHFVGVVLGDQEEEIASAALGDGDEGAEGHEHTAVAVQTDDAALRLCQRDAERERLRVPHRTVGKGEIEFVFGQATPRADEGHGADDDLVGAARGERLEKFLLGQHGFTVSCRQ